MKLRLPAAIDERFLAHRQRSTSLAGMAGAAAAGGLFLFRLHHDQVWNLDLLAVLGAIVVVKLAALAYFRLTG
jgi:hypothetical protein